MNLTDLTTELQARADQAGSTVAAERLAGVRRRVRARRRRQVATAAATVAAIAVLVPGGPWAGDDGRPVPAGPPGPATGPSFDPDDGGDPLVASRVSERATRELELRFTPRDTNLSLADFCNLRSQPPTGDLRAVLTVNGRPFSESECHVDARPGESRTHHGDDPASNRAGWAALDVRPGEESVIRVRVEGDGGAVVLGVGVYELSGARIELGGATIRRRLQAGDHEYSLIGYEAAKITAARRELELPIARERPGWLISGTTGGGADDDQEAVVRVLLDGAELSADAAGGLAGTQVDTTPRKIRLQVPPGVTGTMLLAYYERLATRR